jgi:hypothetical protein
MNTDTTSAMASSGERQCKPASCEISRLRPFFNHRLLIVRIWSTAISALVFAHLTWSKFFY